MFPREFLSFEQEDPMPEPSEPGGCGRPSRAAPDDDYVVRIVFYHKLLISILETITLRVY